MILIIIIILIIIHTFGMHLHDGHELIHIHGIIVIGLADGYTNKKFDNIII